MDRLSSLIYIAVSVYVYFIKTVEVEMVRFFVITNFENGYTYVTYFINFRTT